MYTKPRIDTSIETLETCNAYGYLSVTLAELSVHDDYTTPSCLPVTIEHAINSAIVVGGYYRRIYDGLFDPKSLRYDMIMVDFPFPDREIKMMSITHIVGLLIRLIEKRLHTMIVYTLGVDCDGNVAMFLKKKN